MRKFTFGLITGICLVLLILTITGIIKIEIYRQNGQLVRFGIGNMNFINTEIINDGPYIFFDGDSLAYLEARHNGRHHKEIFRFKDKLFFKHPFDPTKSYTVSSEHPIEPSEYSGVKKIFAVSDVEGNYDALVALLQNNGIVDDSLHWKWSDGHTVFLGDIVDRGDKVTECLWLIHQLEQEAGNAGGRVHYILGNHETMVLAGETRYTHRKYSLAAPHFGVTYQNLYGPDAALGRWLRAKNAVIKINDYIFVHGGLSPALLRHDLSIEKINQLVRSSLDARWKVKHDDILALVYGSNGPLWYRGYVLDKNLQNEEVEAALTKYNADAIVIGHTIVDTVKRLHGGRVIAIDVTFKDESKVESLLWESGKFYRANIFGHRQEI